MDLTTTYAGIKLEHPIMAASSGATRDVAHAIQCQEAGYSAVVLKSVQEEVIMRYNPFPRFAVLRRGIPDYSSTTFYSYEQAYEGGIEEYAETILKAKKEVSIPIIASINCINPNSWGDYAVICEQAGADAIELVPSCPTGKLVREMNDQNSIVLEATRLCKSKVKIPVVPKISSQLANMINTAISLDEEGANGITIFNRATGLEIDIDTMAPILHGGFAGHGGPWALTAVLRWIADISPLIKAEISATNGIASWEDVIRCLLAGASSVQICALMYIKGFDYVQQMRKGLAQYLEQKHLAGITPLKGVAAKKLKSIDELDRSHRYYAAVMSDKCIRCAKCAKVCIYGALSYEQARGPAIDKELCDGCGLCASICGKREAIKMQIK